MAVKMNQVKAALDVDEPRYPEASKLGAGALPHLAKLVSGDDPGLASKAAYLAGLIDKEGSGDIVARAAQSDQIVVRVAAANTASNVTDVAPEVFEGLLADHDPGVRKAGLRSVAKANRGDLKPLVQRVASGDTIEPIRRLAASAAKGLKKPK